MPDIDDIVSKWAASEGVTYRRDIRAYGACEELIHSLARAAFNAGRIEGLEEAARICEAHKGHNDSTCVHVAAVEIRHRKEGK